MYIPCWEVDVAISLAQLLRSGIFSKELMSGEVTPSPFLA